MNLGGRIDFDVLGFLRPPKQAAHGVEEMPRLKWCIAATVAPLGNARLGDRAKRFVAGRGDNLLKDVFTLTPRRQREMLPRRRLAIAFNQPCK